MNMFSKNRTIFLIGFMASGKTTVGKLLARRLGMSFIDTDSEIEKKVGRKIPEIFKTDGEPYFRKLESDILRELVESGNIKNAVVATGGGLPCSEGNLALIKENGIVVYLMVTVHDIVNRIEDADKRPVFKNFVTGGEIYEKVKSLLSYRENYYRQADIIVDNSSGKTPFMVVEEILENIING